MISSRKGVALLCALDFALAEGLNHAVLDLVHRGTLSSIACLSVSDLWPKSAQSLRELQGLDNHPVKLGVALTLTAAFSPLSTGFEPDNGESSGQLPRMEDLARAALHIKLDARVLEAEFRAQIRRFMAHANRKPDFLLLEETLLLFEQPPMHSP